MAEIKYEVVQRIAVLSQRPRGWERQLNLISWNDGEPKYDIRDWSPDGTRMGKGISLSGEELAILKGILDGINTVIGNYGWSVCLPPGQRKAAGLAGQQDGFLLGSGLHPVPWGL